MRRRDFLKITTAASLAGAACSISSSADAASILADAVPNVSAPVRKIRKTVKWRMVEAGDSVLEKFKLQKELGYEGIEFVSPTNVDLAEVTAAAKQTGMPVHGLVNMRHWKIRMSSPKAEQRERAIKVMNQCIVDCKQLGGESVLLVPGSVKGVNESHEDVWQRSIECIKAVLPTAEANNVHVLIENVWNGFCERPRLLRDYIDEIDHPLVRVYFDIGNARKFAPSELWIEILGNRIKKLDVKDWSKDKGFKSKIGDGDVDWPAVCAALDKIQYDGWCTAEVNGGGRERLAEIAERMDKHLLPS